MEAVLWMGGVIAALYVLRWRLKRPLTTHGSAAWASLWKIYRKGFMRPGGVLVGDWYGLSGVHYAGNGHLLTVAPTGTGKGVTAIIPNLLRYEHLFVCDFGGENTAIAAKEWRRKGLAFYCLNPWKMHAGAPAALPSHSVNPLDLLIPESESFVSDAELLAEMIIVRSGNESQSTGFFNDEAQSGLKALLMHAAMVEKPERRNLSTIRDYITSNTERWEALIAAMQATEQTWAKAVLREADQMARRNEQAPEEFSGVLSTMKRCTNFLDDPIVERFLSQSDTRFTDLKGDRGCVISFVMPLENKDSYSSLTRLILGIMLLTMQRPPLARQRVLFVLDEFASLGRVARVANGLATLRKYRVWLWPIFQNIGQIRDLYGTGWEGFVANAELKQFIGAWDYETAEYVSKLCGDATVEVVSEGEKDRRTKSHARRRLITPEEVMRMTDRQVAIIGSLAPMFLATRPYWERPSLRGKFYDNPYHSGTPKLPFSTPWRVLSGAGIKLLAWALAPGLTAVCLYIAAAVFYAQPVVNKGEGVSEGRHVCDYLGLQGKTSYYVSGACPRVLWWFNRADE